MTGASDLSRLLSRITPDLAAGDGAGVRVAVLDSGVDRGDPSIAGRLVEGVIIRDHGRDADGNPTVRRSRYAGRASAEHGNAVAGIIVGLAPQVQLYSADVFDPRHPPTAEALVEGIRWAIENGCRVIHIGGGPLRARLPAARRWRLLDGIEQAYWHDVLVTASAGSAHPQSPLAPATFPGPVSVNRGVFDDPSHFVYRLNGGVEFEAAGRRRVGDREEIAPGLAGPCLAGHACRIRGRYPSLKPFEVKTVLHRLALHFERLRG